MGNGCCGCGCGEDLKDHKYPHDPNFKGPIEKRGCTDIICCVLFVLFFIGFIAVGIFAFTHGNPVRLLYPTNSDGDVCGIGEYKDKPNLFFFDMTACARAGFALAVTGCPTPQICVEKCPEMNFVYLEALNPLNSAAKSNLICKPEVDDPASLSNEEIQKSVEDDLCAPYYVKSTPVIGRCVPGIFGDLKDLGEVLISNTSVQLQDKFGNKVNGTHLNEGKIALELLLNLRDYGSKVLQDLVASWKLMIIFAVMAMIVTLVWILLLRWITEAMIWITILAFILLFAILTYVCFSKYVALKEKEGSDQPFVFTLNLSYYFNLTATWLAFGIITAVILGIILLLVLCLCTQIRIAAALIEESSKAISCMIAILFWPLIPFILITIVLVFWGATAIFLASTGKPSLGLSVLLNNGTLVVPASEMVGNGTQLTANETINIVVSLEEFQRDVKSVLNLIPCKSDNTTAGEICSFVKYGGNTYTIVLQVFQLFMLFWCMNLIEAISTCTVAGAFASYYWAKAPRSKSMPHLPVLSAFWRSIRYHLGSLAFGALIVSIVQIIKTILEYIEQKLKDHENKFAKFCIKCLKCCFWCIEKMVKYLNKNAYIMIAVHGKSFCRSACSAFWLLANNIVRAVVTNSITNFIILLGKLLIVGVFVVLAAYFFSGELAVVTSGTISAYVEEFTPKLNYYPIVIIIIAVGTFIIASIFFSLFDMGVDTLFLCFMEDLDRNDGKTEETFYRAPASLLKILGEKNKKLKKKEPEEEKL